MDASPLAKLSPEIRNIIYEMCLDVGDEKVSLTVPQPAITRTCSQIRAESLLLGYHVPQDFSLTITAAEIQGFGEKLEKWFANLGPAARQQVRSLWVYNDDVSMKAKYNRGWASIVDTLMANGFRGSRLKVQLMGIDEGVIQQTYTIDMPDERPAGVGITMAFHGIHFIARMMKLVKNAGAGAGEHEDASKAGDADGEDAKGSGD